MQDQNAQLVTETSSALLGGAKQRSPSKWNKYVKSYSKAHPKVKGKDLFSAAAKSYRAGRSPRSRALSSSPRKSRS